MLFIYLIFKEYLREWYGVVLCFGRNGEMSVLLNIEDIVFIFVCLGGICFFWYFG